MSSKVQHDILSQLTTRSSFSATLSTASAAEATVKAAVPGKRIYITQLTLVINNTHASAAATITFRNGLTGPAVLVALVRAGQLLSLPIFYGTDAPLTLDPDKALTVQISGVSTSHATAVSVVGYQY